MTVNYIIENLQMFILIVFGAPFIPVFGFICYKREQKENKKKVLNAN